jgi:hypothetical protein
VIHHGLAGIQQFPVSCEAAERGDRPLDRRAEGTSAVVDRCHRCSDGRSADGAGAGIREISPGAAVAGTDGSSGAEIVEITDSEG